MAATGDSHVTFARALASPDKEIRDKTLESLIKYASSLKEITDLEMLKLWKALYYCMWLSDKAPIQQELAGSISELFHSFKKRDVGMLYYRMFYRTMIREWSLLDQHRINKFYYLIRLMLREGLISMQKSGWTEEGIEEEVLTKTPNGLRLHVSDIFLQVRLSFSVSTSEKKLYKKQKKTE
jgi:ribosomal RNA-processing protein 1